MKMVTDVHSHILPGIDDGSSSVEESISMLRMEAAHGIGNVVATPHFYPHRNTIHEFLEARSEAKNRLDRALQQDANLPRILLGAEVYYYPNMSDSNSLKELAIEGTTCILIEMPMTRWTDEMYRELERISTNLRLTPVIAHVDRYIGFCRGHEITRKLMELPVMVQANASFFLRRSTSLRALRMLKRGQIHLLGSDCHNLDVRKPNLDAATDVILRRLGEDAIEWIQSNERVMWNEQ